VNAGDFADPPLRFAVRGLLFNGVEQLVSPAAYTLKLTDPVGAKPPETVAVSVTEPPTVTEADGDVEICGVAFTQVTVAVPDCTVVAPSVTVALAVSVPIAVPM
jgi:hypothetical protein